MNFIPKVPLAPSKCLSKWIKVDKWDYFQNGSQDFFFSFLFSLLILIYFFKYETIVSRNGLSLGYSERDTSSVGRKSEPLFFYTFLHQLFFFVSFDSYSLFVFYHVARYNGPGCLYETLPKVR